MWNIYQLFQFLFFTLLLFPFQNVSGKQPLRYYSRWEERFQNERRTADFALIAEFNANNQNYSVERHQYDFNNDIFVNYFTNSIGPDMITNNMFLLNSVAPYAYNLTNFFIENGLLEKMPPVVLSLSKTAKGDHVFLPLDYYNFAIYYRKSIFNQLGLSPPTTWEGLLNVCQTLKSSGYIPIAIGGKYNWPIDLWWDFIIQRSVSPQEFLDIKQGRVAATSPLIRNAYLLLKVMLDRGYFNDKALSYDWIDAAPLFDNGTAAMYLMGDFIRLQAVSPENFDDVDFFVFPRIHPQAELVEKIVVDGVYIPRLSRNLNGILEFASFIVSKEGMMIRNYAITCPSNSEAMDGDKLNDVVAVRLFNLISDATNILSGGLPGNTSGANRRFWENSNNLDDILLDLEASRQAILFGLVSSPTFDPPEGDYPNPIVVTLTSRTPDSTIYYTIDGSVPHEDSLLYTRPFQLNAGRYIVRAISVKEGLTRSQRIQAEYNIKGSDGTGPTTLMAVFIAIFVLITLAVPSGIVGFMVHRRQQLSMVRHYQTRAERAEASYVLQYEDIEFGPRIGEGSTGEVYQGVLYDTTVAIKQLRVGRVKREVLESFLIEAKTLSNLRHPNCVLFMGVTTSPRVCIVTEFMGQGTLYDVLHNQDIHLDYDMMLNFARDAARGMNYLHSYHPPLLHRDLKSPNLLIDDKMGLKISDFGLATLKEGASDDGSARGPQGSYYWMAPEVAKDQNYSEQGDVYSYGIILWEIFTRRELYEGMNPLTVIYNVIHRELRPEIPKNCPEPIKILMKKCWQHDPLDRPSFKEILHCLPDGNQSFGKGNLRLSYDDSDYSDEISIGPVIKSRIRVKVPTGEVTIVFTDIFNSSLLWERYPLAMRDAISVHNNIIRNCIIQYSGYEAKVEGGAFMITFADPFQAVQFVFNIQESLVEAKWPADILDTELTPTELDKARQVIYRGLRVRTGLYTGSVSCAPDPTSGRMYYFGPVVNRALRVASAGHGGQIIMGESTYRKIVDEIDTLPPHVVEQLGSFYLKGLDQPENLLHIKPMTLQARIFDSHLFNVVPRGSSTSSSLVISSNSYTPPTKPLPAGLKWKKSKFNILDYVEKYKWSVDFSELELGPLIGVGSFGEVFSATWKTRGQQVAVKRVLQQMLNEETMLDFVAEVSLLSQLRHPNIILFMGACITPPNIAVIMELAESGSLRFLLKTKGHTLTFENKLSICIEIAQAMLFLHSNNPPIMHRDLKTQNILIDKSLRVKVADFGFATLKIANQTLTVVGTAQFTAPEIIRGLAYSLKADVYSFGIVLWEILTNSDPYHGINTVQICSDVLDGKRPSIPSDAPEPFKSLIPLCWHYDPDVRPSFAELLPMLKQEGNYKPCK